MEGGVFALDDFNFETRLDLNRDRDVSAGELRSVSSS
jgi:hypothetical protein